MFHNLSRKYQISCMIKVWILNGPFLERIPLIQFCHDNKSISKGQWKFVLHYKQNNEVVCLPTDRLFLDNWQLYAMGGHF